jgi:hypothetical protein
MEAAVTSYLMYLFLYWQRTWARLPSEQSWLGVRQVNTLIYFNLIFFCKQELTQGLFMNFSTSESTIGQGHWRHQQKFGILDWVNCDGESVKSLCYLWSHWFNLILLLVGCSGCMSCCWLFDGPLWTETEHAHAHCSIRPWMVIHCIRWKITLSTRNYLFRKGAYR